MFTLLKNLKKHLFWSIALLAAGTAFAQDQGMTPLPDSEEVFVIALIQLGGNPMCFEESKGFLQIEPTLPNSELNDTSYYSVVADKACKGAVGAMFGGSTGKFLTYFFGGESLSRLLEIAGVSEVSGHSSGQFICEYLFDKNNSVEAHDITWLLESNDFSDISPVSLWEQAIAQLPSTETLPSIAYNIGGIALRGVIVTILVKRLLGIGNPVLGFIISAPIRSIYDFVRNYGEDTAYEAFYGDDDEST